ncbi:Cys-tRNA(Pro) deacylase [Sediminivirga luteola]|uniref:Cys-tRNA(Pro)/Cys-tRNA(Cys) deacylase n=1 Tax=Sediminivirga luteola TaxID=1774748 RepID=A0A8J2U164_9MICO|nr:Cys-tRNA(Pro) deacylase [Sediminivirga luteola]MCI2266016.1 Cys-tRNA(Pro) deacylase [Sediminivirga luteola]GGA28002.1 Cys-tRNA(Pro)/Cys-tRNA(Cys) deacylase [Sediminivirga luteola]
MSRISLKEKHPAATPALRVLSMAGASYTLHQFEHNPHARSLGHEVCSQLGVDPERVLKTLMISVDDTLVTAVVPVSGQLDLRALASAVGGKRAQLAGIAEAERRTGYVRGGTSPLGQRNPSPTVVDITALDYETVLVSAGRRGMEIELSPHDLVLLTNAQVARIANLD